MTNKLKFTHALINKRTGGKVIKCFSENAALSLLDIYGSEYVIIKLP